MLLQRAIDQQRCWFSLIVLFLATLFTLWVRPTAAQIAPPISPGVVIAAADPPLAYAPGVVIVKLKPGVRLVAKPGAMAANAAVSTNNPGLEQALQASGVSSAEALFSVSVVGTARIAGVDNPLARIYRLHLAADANVATAVELLRTNAAVEYAEPDYLAQAALIPNDPMWGNQWALNKINAPAAWDVTQGAATTIIALIDSGLDLAHPDLAGKLWQNDDIAGNGIDDDQNGKIDDSNGWNFVTEANNVADMNGHGTQVAGVAGASTNNSLGVAGLCWHCPLMPVVAMQANGVANYSTVANAVVYAAANGASVINLSLGGYADSSLLREAIREAATTAVIVAAAGNDDNVTPFYPAAYPEVIAVAATGATDQKAIFSNYGPWVDLAAPGELIQTTTISDYTASSGTSVATPLVAGVAGLLKSHHPDWSPALITWQLLNTVAPVDGMNPTYAGQLGHGRLDAGAALTQPPQARVQVTGYTVDGQSNGRPAPGQSFPLVLTLRNIWMPAQSLVGSLTTTDTYVTIGDPQGVFGDIGPGATGQNNSDPFVVTLQPNTPYNRVLPLTLTLIGANGYTTTVPFMLQVRTAVETLGNTQYTQNTTWTSDKTYILNGTVIVGQGITLTIQPGTVVKGNPGKFIRVDGTLVAQGMAEQPILFTSNSITNTRWGGIRFTDSAGDTKFDLNGNYSGGSVLHFINLSYADAGISVGTRTLYIADSTFRNSNTSIMSGAGNSNVGYLRIERSTFTENNTAISVNNAALLLRQSSFTSNGWALSANSAAQILDNRFTNNRLGAINLTCCGGTPLIIRGNVVTGNNSGAIQVSGTQFIEIEHNLIAENGGICTVPPCGAAAVTLELQSAPGGQSAPTLVHNGTRNEYLLVWSESHGMKNAILAQRLSKEGEPVGDEIALGDGHYTAVAYNPSNQEYLVALSGGGAFGKISVQRLATDGALIGNSAVITTGLANRVQTIYQPDNNSYLVAWEGYSCSGSCRNRIYVQHIAADGAPIGNMMLIGAEQGSANLTLGNMAYDPTSQRSLITFRSDQQPRHVYGGWVSANSTAYPSLLIAQDAENRQLQNPSLAFSSTAARFLAVWERSDPMNFRAPRPLFGSLMAADGSVVISQTLVWAATAAAAMPSIAYNNAADQFTVAWAQNPTPGIGVASQVVAQRIGSDGITVDTPITITALPPSGNGGGEITSPVVVYNAQENEYLLVWTDSRLGRALIFGQRINAVGQLLDNPWTPGNETIPSTNFRVTIPKGIRANTIINNSGFGVQLSGSAAWSVSIAQNNLFGNGQYDLYLNNGAAGTRNFTVNASNNFWNVDPAAIADRIHDCTFDENGCGSPSSTVGKVQSDPPLTEPSQEAPAFVQRAALNPDPVGLNQPGAVTVDFSRPMITATLPTVTFHDARRGTVQSFNSTYARAITQDAIGRLWFGTERGVNMFDGRQWYTYTTATSGLGSNNINAIYNAANGDVWFGGVSMFVEEAPLSRLQGSTWITYSQVSNMNQGPVLAISQDAGGAMWFGAGERGAYRFDGVAWQQFTTADGLSANYVRQIVRDGQGRLWFMTGRGMIQSEPGGLDLFDGNRWQTYNRATGMPTNAFAALFADSQGGVWASISAVPNQQFYVAMFNGTAWHFFGLSETNSHLSCTVSSFAEASNGAIWMNSCNGTVTYQSGVWERVTNALTAGSVFFIDEQDNFWYSNMQVQWGGLNYPFENGRWLSPTRYQSNYNFTALVPQGVYAVDVNGAIGTDGIEAVPDAADTFRVDFGIAANPVPPFAPAITAENNGTLTTITAHWRTESPDIEHYRYAIGTTPGARNVVGWTYLTTNRMTRTDLALIQGQPYYVSVQARNKFGLWSASGVSNQVIGGVVTTLPTPATPPPGGPTATPAGETPTPTATPAGVPLIPTPTPLGGTPVLTPTMTMTPVPSQSLNAIGETSGAPGSRFIFAGSGFPPNTQLPVFVTPLPTVVAAGPLVMVGVVTTDANGSFTFTLVTTVDLPAGRYQLTVGEQQQTRSAFVIDPTAPLRQPAVAGVVITMAKPLYLPLIYR